jgi:hypothetical protein
MGSWLGPWVCWVPGWLVEWNVEGIVWDNGEGMV